MYIISLSSCRIFHTPNHNIYYAVSGPLLFQIHKKEEGNFFFIYFSLTAVEKKLKKKTNQKFYCMINDLTLQTNETF